MNRPHTTTLSALLRNGWKNGFSLLEVLVSTGILSVAFLGLFGTVNQAGKMAAAAEEEALAVSALEERIDDLRSLEWPELTNGTGIINKVWAARAGAVAGLPVTSETIALKPLDLAGTQTVSAAWTGVATKTLTTSAGTNLGKANAVEVVATLSWASRGSSRPQTRNLVTIISRGGVSKSDRP